jgi:hypothetical protein
MVVRVLQKIETGKRAGSGGVGGVSRKGFNEECVSKGLKEAWPEAIPERAS